MMVEDDVIINGRNIVFDAKGIDPDILVDYLVIGILFGCDA